MRQFYRFVNDQLSQIITIRFKSELASPARSGLQVRMCFSRCVNRQPRRGLQTASLKVPEHRGCSGWQKRKADVSHGRREKKGWGGGLAKNTSNSSALKFLWMRFCQGSGNRKGRCICFPTDGLFSHRWWQEYTKQYGAVWNCLKATLVWYKVQNWNEGDVLSVPVIS